MDWYEVKIPGETDGIIIKAQTSSDAIEQLVRERDAAVADISLLIVTKYSKYLDALSGDEYKALSKKLWIIQNHRCFICEEEIDLDVQTTKIYHFSITSHVFMRFV